MKPVWLFGLMGLFASSLYADIVYNDIEDQVLSYETPIVIDFDNDGTAEFTITDTYPDVELTEIYTEFSGPAFRIGTNSDTEWDHITGWDEDTTVDENTGWHDFGYAYILDGFPVDQSTYLIAQFPIDGETHYGWIEAEWDGDGSFTVKSFAYEDSPGEAIETGDTGESSGLSINEEHNEFPELYPQPAQNELHFTSAINSYHIYDMKGQLISHREELDQSAISITTLEAGVYLIHCITEQKTFRKRFIKI